MLMLGRGLCEGVQAGGQLCCTHRYCRNGFAGYLVCEQTVGKAMSSYEQAEDDQLQASCRCDTRLDLGSIGGLVLPYQCCTKHFVTVFLKATTAKAAADSSFLQRTRQILDNASLDSAVRLMAFKG
jgi:hypothetical protein